mmetsp:Transcript_25921/g.38397  ORF Transcript_25921/g.38397 Transcript_25921/m.38397 type:complete len:261 (+) Transcript_25921:69-851(+)
MVAAKTIAIFFSRGAFGDCARHSILHALDDSRVGKIKVYSTSMSSLDEANWKCGCGVDHGAQLKDSPNSHKIERIPVKTLTGPLKEVSKEVDLQNVDAVISGIGNRQMFIGDRVAERGTENITSLMKQNGIERFVMMSSIGIKSDIGNDKPCMEWRVEGKFMAALFNTVSWREYNDLKGAENKANSSGVNFLAVRPVGLGEEVQPAGKYFIQNKKFEDALGANMAKADVGKFMVNEALQPTYHRKAVVIGADPKEAFIKF